MGSHYVPQEYLRGFADPESPGMIWMYDRRSGAFKLVPILTVAQERGYYDDEGRLT
jgi:hypothetical protein